MTTFPSRLSLLLFMTMYLLAPNLSSGAVDEAQLRETIGKLSSYGSRSVGTEGYSQSAEYIKKKLTQFGLSPKSQSYDLAVRRFAGAELKIGERTYELNQLNYNSITPGATEGSITGPLYYVGRASLEELDGKDLAGSIALLDFDSGRNWQLLASLGVKAAIYIENPDTRERMFFREKEELTPLQFPCFYMDKGDAERIFGPLELTASPTELSVELNAKSKWTNADAENIYAFIQGTDPELSDELLVIESFFDNREYVAGKSPGADAAASLATFLEIAQAFALQPPARSVLLLATSGHPESLAGMREAIWGLSTKFKELKKEKKTLKENLSTMQAKLSLLESIRLPVTEDEKREAEIGAAIHPTINEAVDQVSRKLIRLRMARDESDNRQKVKAAAKLRFDYRRLGWAESYHNLPPDQEKLFEELLPKAITATRFAVKDIKHQLENLNSTLSLREAVDEYEIGAVISLHLSSHGNGVGAFNQGFLYNLKKEINRTSIYGPISTALEEAATTAPSSRQVVYQDTLRPNLMRTWDSWFLDQPPLGGEVSALAGNLGLTLVTTGDGRQAWGTPYDTPAEVNFSYLHDQAELVTHLISHLAGGAKLHSGKLPKSGFVTVTGRTNLLLQGELFADFPAAGTTILGYQGLNKFYAMVNTGGLFSIKGLADKKHVLDKLVIEGYRFDPETGEVLWAIDKKETGISNYRLKLLRRSMQTDLVMFNCKETTLFDLLEPRSFNYMTKIHLFDGRRDAPPEHYWYSRIDTRDSIISSIYTEPGTMLKLTLSDTVLTNKMILTNGRKAKPMGSGYNVDKFAAITNTPYHAASDAWNLLSPRIASLEKHGIFDERINSLKKRGLEALDTSRTGFENFQYTKARASAAESLALADRVYVQVEKTQKDVLFGVLFYIALFVPFAFVVERFLFNFASIYKRILGFSGILVILIAIIYSVHPAFELAYSPMVVILAFFIIGLSLMVTLIIFFRFEDEMVLLQRRASHKRPEEISRWKAFTAAFFLGVSNLRRRRIRTLLTCTTLIILTFTIMSFTTIKSNRQQVRLLFQDNAPYLGLLLKKMNHLGLPPQAEPLLVSAASSPDNAAPRVWFEGEDLSRPLSVPIKNGPHEVEAHGLIGLGHGEQNVTRLDKLLTGGRWFMENERNAIIISETMAERLGVSPPATNAASVTLWGTDYKVIGTFRGEDLDNYLDLDGEPLTPVIYPDETATEMTEEELDAMESGDDVRSFQSRYRHIPGDQTVIIPARTLLAAGGSLKNIALRPENQKEIAQIAARLTDRFNLAIFTGEKNGVWLYNMSDTMNYSGVPNIIIPLLISVLIVLNTMISSVYERKSEIAVYTSVGLAPSHVAFLFVAEAMALAVVSVVLGYLVAQVSAALLSATPLWNGITVNYSSMAGVAAMILVILVVLISVLYPAKVAARIAIPDVNRTFRLPKPDGNTITVTLPFLMKFREHDSIGGFMYSYLVSHRDISHGLFSTGPVEVIFSCSTMDEIVKMVGESERPQDLSCLHIRTSVWLAPFDFGIMQTADIQFCPAREGQEFLEIKLTLQRRSGESGIWQRINVSFLHELRKQLLIWRSLDDDAHRELEKSFRETTSPFNQDSAGLPAAEGA